MSRQINVNEDSYKKFQASLLLTGEEEEIVIDRLLNQYARIAFEKVVNEKTNLNDKQSINVTEIEQKQLFINWFRNLTKRNGKKYNPVTISGYAGRIENACQDPIFVSIPVKNLFTITDSTKFIHIQKQIKECSGYVTFDEKCHNGFTAALKKYEEFLKFQEMDNIVPNSVITSTTITSSNIHHWTMEEDIICCKRFFEYYVIKQSDIDTVQFLQMIKKEIPNISEGSLRMKIQNIKYLAMQEGLKDTSTIKCLSQYSTQCKKAFKQIMNELTI